MTSSRNYLAVAVLAALSAAGTCNAAPAESRGEYRSGGDFKVQRSEGGRVERGGGRDADVTVRGERGGRDADVTVRGDRGRVDRDVDVRSRRGAEVELRRRDHDRGWRRAGYREHIHRGHRYSWGPGVAFYFTDGYYYGECRWLKRRALQTGSPVWWSRYERCRDFD